MHVRNGLSFLTICALWALLLAACDGNVQSNKRGIGPAQEGQFSIIAPAQAQPITEELKQQIRLTTVRVIANLETKPSTCSGVLIASEWVLTAAHCVKSGPMVIQLPELGSEEIKRKLYRLRDPKIQIEVVKSFVHPLYALSKNDAAFDLALLKLARVPSAPYTKASFNSTGSALPSRIVIAGFGNVMEQQPAGLDSVLNFNIRDMQLDLTELGYLDFTKLGYYKYRENYRFRNEFPIWSWDQNDRSQPRICHGDSGGPLFEVQGNKLKLIGINSAYEGDQRACNGNALAANVEYNRKFIEQTQASEQLPKLEDIAELRLEQGFGGMWSYSAARSIFSRSGATHEIYFADTQALACELPKDLRSLNDERKFISTFAKNGSPYMTTVDLHSKIEQSVWNGNVLQLKYVEKNRQYALGHLEESVLTRLYFLPQGPRFTRLPIVKCD